MNVPPKHLKLVMKALIEGIVKDDIEAVVKRSISRLSASEIRSILVDYGSNFICPPDNHYNEAIRFGVLIHEYNSFWVDLPFYSQEEGRSDLEIQFSAYFDSNNSLRRLELDNVTVL